MRTEIRITQVSNEHIIKLTFLLFPAKANLLLEYLGIKKAESKYQLFRLDTLEQKTFYKLLYFKHNTLSQITNLETYIPYMLHTVSHIYAPVVICIF